MIWFTSDLHLCHNKPFLYEPRGFISVQEMNEAIVRNWNSVVKPSDVVFILGDLMLNDNELGINYINKLNGRKSIVIGNHDTANRILLYNSKIDNLQGLAYGDMFEYNGYHFYLSHYATLTSNHDYNKPLKHRVISLCGHTHTKDKFADWDKGLIYHCELDAHNNFPVSVEEIIKDIEEKLKEIS